MHRLKGRERKRRVRLLLRREAKEESADKVCGNSSSQVSDHLYSTVQIAKTFPDLHRYRCDILIHSSNPHILHIPYISFPTFPPVDHILRFHSLAHEQSVASSFSPILMTLLYVKIVD